MNNNAQIRVQGQLSNFERLVENIRNMTDNEIKDLEIEVKNKSTTVKGRVDLVSILAGREISKSAYQKLENMILDEFMGAKTHHTFISDTRPCIDRNTGQPAVRTIYYSPQAIACKQANVNMLSEEDFDGAQRQFNKYELRRENGLAHKNVLDNIRRAIRIVKKERIEAEHAAKKTKIVCIGELGAKLLKDQPVQQVASIIKL